MAMALAMALVMDLVMAMAIAMALVMDLVMAMALALAMDLALALALAMALAMDMAPSMAMALANNTRTMIMGLLCNIGIHKKRTERKTVYKDDRVETVNFKESCDRCGKLLDEYGITHFSFSFKIKDNDNG